MEQGRGVKNKGDELEGGCHFVKNNQGGEMLGEYAKLKEGVEAQILYLWVIETIG